MGTNEGSVTARTAGRVSQRENHVGEKKMRHPHHIRRNELMNPDLLSEVVLVASVLVVIVGLMVFLLHALG